MNEEVDVKKQTSMPVLFVRCLAVPVALLSVLTCVVPALPATAQGTTYYVATTGSDAPGCGTVGSPCQTIQYAADLVEAGDTVLINPGTYAGGVTVETGGADGEPITFRASGSGVVINGSGGERDAFFITWADYVVVEGLTIQNADRAGVRIDNSHHVTVRDCTFANNGTWGLFTDFSDYTTVENCESYGSVDEHGIYISNSSDYPTIRGNRLHHNNGCGLHMNGDISMQPGDGIISYALVEDNVIYENGAGGGSGINMDGVTHSLIRNNLLYDNHASGISIYQIDGGSGSHDNRVLNNTIVMASNGRWGINIPGTGDTNNKLFNNIVYNYHSWRGSITIGSPTLSGFESDYNVLMDRFSTDDGDTRITLAQWQALGYDAHSILATPTQLFVDASADDYHLKAGSPAINAGTLLGDVTDDLEGNPRPVGATHDAGAYEYQDDAFDLAVAPATRRIFPGGVATYTLSLQPTGAFTGTAALTAANPSLDLILSLNPAAVDPPGQATLIVTDTHTGPLSPVVSYTIPITATGGGITRTVSVNLRVGDNQAPYIPFAPNPAHGAVEVSTSQVLSWQGGDPDSDPVTYTIAFGTGSPPPPVAMTAQAQYTPSLEPETAYYWRITASDGISETIGPVWQFTTLTETRVYLPLVFRAWSGAPPQIEGCNIFPADHIWNVPVDDLPLDSNSAAYVATIGYNTGLHADFGSGEWPPGSGSPIGIPFTTVPGTQPLVDVTFDYGGESDPGPYPVPPDAPIEGGPDSDGDRHVLVVDRDNCVLYEMYDAWPQPDGSWEAGSGAIFDLKSYGLRHAGWTSADAAGLPILPGMVRYDEVTSGEIRHAIRFTAPQTRQAYVWPARHYASSLTGSQYPPMGQRFRLKAGFDISGFSPEVQVILQAMKTYGIILADNGSSWFISGAPDERWDNDVLHELGQVHGHDFEAVDVSLLMIDPDSGQAQQ
jgi:parallel beta-helix repeat protein